MAPTRTCLLLSLGKNSNPRGSLYVEVEFVAISCFEMHLHVLITRLRIESDKRRASLG